MKSAGVKREVPYCATGRGKTLVSSSIAGTNVPDVPKGTTATTTQKPYPWIIHPVFDFFFVTGGGVLVFMLINYLYMDKQWLVPTDMSQPSQMALITIMFMSQHIFAD